MILCPVECQVIFKGHPRIVWCCIKWSSWNWLRDRSWKEWTIFCAQLSYWQSLWYTQVYFVLYFGGFALGCFVFVWRASPPLELQQWLQIGQSYSIGSWWNCASITEIQRGWKWGWSKEEEKNVCVWRRINVELKQECMRNIWENPGSYPCWTIPLNASQNNQIHQHNITD